MSGWTAQDGTGCQHAAGLPAPSGPAAPPAPGCTDCMRDGGRWVRLRRCTECGHVGCCDSSPQQHAAAHWRATGHPVAASAEPRERWAWCYPDRALLLAD